MRELQAAFETPSRVRFPLFLQQTAHDVCSLAKTWIGNKRTTLRTMWLVCSADTSPRCLSVPFRTRGGFTYYRLGARNTLQHVSQRMSPTILSGHH